MGKLTRFEVGQTVRATTTAQGLVQGTEYEVLDLETQSTFVGTFVRYHLRAVGDATGATLVVGNGHLLLTEVDVNGPRGDQRSCPVDYCNARPGQVCISKSGRKVPTHPARLTAKVVLAFVFAASLFGGACATTAPATQVEAVGSLAPSYHSIATAPVHATTGLSPGVQAVSTDEDVPAAVVGAGEAESPDVAPKGGLTMGGVR